MQSLFAGVPTPATHTTSHLPHAAACCLPHAFAPQFAGAFSMAICVNSRNDLTECPPAVGATDARGRSPTFIQK